MERSGGFVQAITIDQEIWQAFGESEEAIQKALRKLAREINKKKKKDSDVISAAWKALFGGGKKRAPKKKTAKPAKSKKRR